MMTTKYLINPCKIEIEHGQKKIVFATKKEEWLNLSPSEVDTLKTNFMFHMSSMGDIVVLDFDSMNNHVLCEVRKKFKNSVIARTNKGVHVYVRVSDESLRRYIATKQYHYLLLDTYKVKIEIYSNFSNRCIIAPVVQNDRYIAYVNSKIYNEKRKFSDFIRFLNKLDDSSELLDSILVKDDLDYDFDNKFCIKEENYKRKSVKDKANSKKYEALFGADFKDLNMKIIFENLQNAKIGERNTKFFYAYMYFVSLNEVIEMLSDDLKQIVKDTFLCGITKEDFYEVIDKIYHKSEKHDKEVCRYILEKYQFKNNLKSYISTKVVDMFCDMLGLTPSYCYFENGEISAATAARKNYTLFMKDRIAYKIENSSEIKVYKVKPNQKINLKKYIRAKAYEYENKEHTCDYIIFKTNKRTGFKTSFVDINNNIIEGEICYYIPFCSLFDYEYNDGKQVFDLNRDRFEFTILNVFNKLFELDVVTTSEKISYCYEFFKKDIAFVTLNEIEENVDYYKKLFQKKKITKFYLSYHFNSLFYIAERKGYDFILKKILDYAKEFNIKMSVKIRNNKMYAYA